ncbi:hypothetical protein [Streptomyces halobius]|uniref:Helix-turn-helix domain-containing protein n=1 Tax=Streptomyces halobius TaxID=2879846 RepID=A0ABY4MEG8_9ACTN|nr:hypothetical protein [Streptomyces halobius]UQA95717.1 hypothetical protein K9S39_31075 [Streptomyces halobius]
MSDDEQVPRPGSVPHTFGNALAWRWTRDMPPSLKGGFLTMLYALRTMANASGELRFSGDRKPIRIQDLAKAAGCREKDGRRYIDAAIRAGVVGLEGERRRGRSALYFLVITPWPDWKAADDHLKATARPRKDSADEKSTGGSSGHSGLNSKAEENGPQRPELPESAKEGERAAAARMGSGHSGPNGSGRCGPNNPGSTHEVSQERVDVVPQPPVRAGARDEEDQSPQPTDDGELSRRCTGCGIPLVRFSRTLCHGCKIRPEGTPETTQRPVQGAFLTPVPSRTEPLPIVPMHVPVIQEDPLAPLRICGCGREYRHRKPGGRCPDCHYAQQEEAREVSGA